MDLPAFIDRIGDEKAARLFREKARIVKSWRLKERRPTAKKAPRLIEASNGILNYESIFSYTLKKSKS